MLQITPHLPRLSETDSRVIHLDPPRAVSNWYAVYTAPRHEKKLAQHFCARQIEHFLPLYRAARRWKDGSRVTLELPLFPSYIFVRIPRSQRVRVLEVPGVLSIVGKANEPAALLECEIEALRQAVMSATMEPHPYLVVGQRVQITNGPLMGMEGVLQRKKNSLRVVLTVSIIMQSVAVEIDACDLVPVASHSIIASSLSSIAA